MGGDRGLTPVPRRGPVARGGPVAPTWRWPVGVVDERRSGARVGGGPRVVLLTYPGADLLDVAGPCAVFDAFEHAPGRPEEDTTPGYRATINPGGSGWLHSFWYTAPGMVAGAGSASVRRCKCVGTTCSRPP